MYHAASGDQARNGGSSSANIIQALIGENIA